MRRAFLIFAVLDLVIVAWAVYDETITRRPWKAVQAEWNRALAKRGEKPVAVAIHEVTNPALALHDRCQSCHLGVARDGYGEDLPRHLRTHPHRAELFAAHPPERFGCTTCHQGQGPQTKGIARAKFDHGRDDPYWERPLLDGSFVQSSCLDCHDAPPKGAEVLARGRELFEDLRCYGCHSAIHFEPPAVMAAPSLELLRLKTSQSFVEEWLREPRALRPSTRMPSFWPAPVEPADANLSPAGSPRHQAWQALREQEPKAIAAYLAAQQPARALPEVALSVDVNDGQMIEEGKALFDRVGCRACHVLSAAEAKAMEEAPPREAHFGPSLEAVGEKASARWLAAWLRKPSAVWPEARMPNLRITDAELGRLVAFLVSLRRPGHDAARAEWTEAGAIPPALVEAGREAITRLGCAGCHQIPGIKREGRPGPDLDTFGDKTAEEIIFGEARVDCSHLSTVECGAIAKLKWPRRYQSKSVPPSAMPDYALSDEDARSLAVFLVANRSREIPPAYRRPLDAHERAVDRGEQMMTRRNCRGCHEIGRTPGVDANGEKVSLPVGGWIRRYYEEPAMAPPPLTHAGRKFQYPWLWEFLRAPLTVRPFLAVRMPDFGLTEEEINAVAASFAARDGEPYPTERHEAPRVADSERGEAQRLFEQLKCRQCHPAPGVTGQVKSRAELAPDLALSPTRLKPAWVRAWLADPQALQPNTRMPTFFAPLDEDKPEIRSALPGYFGDDTDRQIDALVGVVMSREAPRPPSVPGGM